METTAWRSPIEYSHHFCIECVADPVTALSPGYKCWEKTEITIFSEPWNTFWFHRTAKVSRSFRDLNNFLTQLYYISSYRVNLNFNSVNKPPTFVEKSGITASSNF